MKNTILLAALLVVSSSALANPGSYVGVNVGSTELKITADGDSGSENGTGGKVYAGYQFTPAIGAELGYVRFGDISATEDGFTVGFKPNSFYAALTGTMVMTPKVNLFGKIGAARTDSNVYVEYQRERISIDRSGTSVMFGLGVQYKFSERLSLVAEYENFGKILKLNSDDLSADANASLVSVGLRYAF